MEEYSKFKEKLANQRDTIVVDLRGKASQIYEMEGKVILRTIGLITSY